MDDRQNFDLPEDRPITASSNPRLHIMAGGVICLLLIAAVQPHGVKAAWDEFSKIIGLTSDPLPASPARLSDHETEELARMTPQLQAERLLERSINHYGGAIELISAHVGEWYGQLSLSPKFNSLLDTALNANDLRVRAAAIEIELATYNVPKTPVGSDLLVERISEQENRYWALWMMGALGNRGVDPDRAFSTLMDHVKDSDEMTRFWAVEGMAMLGSDNTIRPLLDIFRSDPSLKIRERAACSLAQSGMLTKNQRMTAVPEIIGFLDDASVDSPTRGWAVQALNDITAAGLGSDAAAWRSWWAQHQPH